MMEMTSETATYLIYEEEAWKIGLVSRKTGYSISMLISAISPLIV